MVHYKNELGEKEAETGIVEEFEKRYDKILECAKKEYEDELPNDHYREGYNLYLRLVKYKKSEFLFLHDKYVMADNSLAERLPRQYKRKQKQEGNFYHKVISIFERPRPKKNS